jgi:hypothetical protein
VKLLRSHPAADLFPMMTDGELNALAKDIVNCGQHHPILLVEVGGESLILDGRNRFEACRRAGVQPKTTVWTGEDPIAAIWSLNCERRHLTESQRAMIGEGFATMKQGKNSNAQACAFTESASQIAAAKLVGVSRRLLQGARRVKTKGVPELVAAVQAGEVSVTAAAEVAALPVEEQQRLVANGAPAIVERANRRETMPAPRLVVRNGALTEETKPGVFQQKKQKLYDLSVQPTWRTRLDDHAAILALLKKDMRVADIAEKTGLDLNFVHHSVAPYRIRPKVMANVISDMQVTAETWASWAKRIDQKWAGASREEKDQLVEQLEACRRSAATFIRELKKEARTEGENT